MITQDTLNMLDKVNVELGCGKVPNPECNVLFDAYDFVAAQPDFVDSKKIFARVDFEKEPLPLPDNSVDYMYSNHVIEHIRDVQILLNEAWRVLKPSGEFYIKVPYGLWRGASKPVHYQCITACWFDWLRREDIYKWYGYRSWKIEKLEEVKNKDGEKYEVVCVMKPNKD